MFNRLAIFMVIFNFMIHKIKIQNGWMWNNFCGTWKLCLGWCRARNGKTNNVSYGSSTCHIICNMLPNFSELLLPTKHEVLLNIISNICIQRYAKQIKCTLIKHQFHLYKTNLNNVCICLCLSLSKILSTMNNLQLFFGNPRSYWPNLN
jgi:hypothetical protein